MAKSSSDRAEVSETEALRAELAELISRLYAGELRLLRSILKEFASGQADDARSEAALLSERSLAKDWNRPEEDEAWRDL